jgi:hypothetical protein
MNSISYYLKKKSSCTSGIWSRLSNQRKAMVQSRLPNPTANIWMLRKVAELISMNWPPADLECAAYFLRNFKWSKSCNDSRTKSPRLRNQISVSFVLHWSISFLLSIDSTWSVPVDLMILERSVHHNSCKRPKARRRPGTSWLPID